MSPNPIDDRSSRPDPHGAAPLLSVVLPMRDEALALPDLMDELDKVLGATEGGIEYIFVDDGSSDGSLDLVRAREARDPRFRAIALGGHFGQSAALDRGFKRARGQIIVTLDADGQNDPRDVPPMLRLLDGADVICGVRTDRQDNWRRRVASRVANFVRNRLTGEQISDVGCSLRVMRADLLRGLDLDCGLHRFLPTLLRIRGARVVEMPVSHRPRRVGESKYAVLDRLPEALRDLMTVRRMQAAARKRMGAGAGRR